ncbi:importin subunit beta-1 [Tanacetum coccineum]
MIGEIKILIGTTKESDKGVKVSSPSRANQNMTTPLSNSFDVLNTAEKEDVQNPKVNDHAELGDESDDDEVYMPHGGGFTDGMEDDLECYDGYGTHVYDLTPQEQAFCDQYDIRLNSHGRKYAEVEKKTSSESSSPDILSIPGVINCKQCGVLIVIAFDWQNTEGVLLPVLSTFNVVDTNSRTISSTQCKQLEDSGVLNDFLRSRSNSWGLHVRCREKTQSLLILCIAFTDQKRRFFPHLDEDSGDEPIVKKHCGTETSTATASLLARSSSETLDEPPKDNGYYSSRDIRSGLGGAVAADQIAMIELLLPTVFRAVISLHPIGLLDLDAVVFFSVDELLYLEKSIGCYLSRIALLNLCRQSKIQMALRWSTATLKRTMENPMVFQLVPVIMMELHKILEEQKLSSDERQKQNELQVCRSNYESFPYGFACRNAIVHEEAMFAIRSLAYSTGPDFAKYMPKFYKYLEMGLQNFEEYQVCVVTVGVVGDICRAIEDKVLPWCDGIMTQLLKDMSSNQLHR